MFVPLSWDSHYHSCFDFIFCSILQRFHIQYQYSIIHITIAFRATAWFLKVPCLTESVLHTVAIYPSGRWSFPSVPEGPSHLWVSKKNNSDWQQLNMCLLRFCVTLSFWMSFTWLKLFIAVFKWIIPDCPKRRHLLALSGPYRRE